MMIDLNYTHKKSLPHDFLRVLSLEEGPQVQEKSQEEEKFDFLSRVSPLSSQERRRETVRHGLMSCDSFLSLFYIGKDMFFLPFFLQRVIRFLISFFYSFVFSFISSGIDFSFFKTWDDEDTNGRERRRRRRNTHKTCQFCAHNIFSGLKWRREKKKEKRVKKVLHFSRRRGTWRDEWRRLRKSSLGSMTFYKKFHLLQSLLHFSLTSTHIRQSYFRERKKATSYLIWMRWKNKEKMLLIQPQLLQMPFFFFHKRSMYWDIK